MRLKSFRFVLRLFFFVLELALHVLSYLLEGDEVGCIQLNVYTIFFHFSVSYFIFLFVIALLEVGLGP